MRLKLAEIILDTTGTVCPMPAFKTKKQALKMAAGDKLLVKGDFPPAVENIVRVAEKSGCKILEQKVEGGNFEILIEKMA
ncbi:MAG: sulfurtransferase TusA family protein [Candidatus Hodarchaeota archaeon]